MRQCDMRLNDDKPVEEGGISPRHERQRLVLVHGTRVGEIKGVEHGKKLKKRADQETEQHGWGVAGGKASSEGGWGCWHPQCERALATSRHVLCAHCAAHGQRRQALLQDMRKAMAHVKATMRWTPPKSDTKYETIVHTPKCPAYLMATLALRGIDSRRSGHTETDEE